MAHCIPDNPNARLTREQTAAALTNAGYPVKPKTLSTKASRGGGPPYQLFGPRAIYRWADALAWAEARLSEPRQSTSETDGNQGIDTGATTNTPTAPVQIASSRMIRRGTTRKKDTRQDGA